MFFSTSASPDRSRFDIDGIGWRNERTGLRGTGGKPSDAGSGGAGSATVDPAGRKKRDRGDRRKRQAERNRWPGGTGTGGSGHRRAYGCPADGRYTLPCSAGTSTVVAAGTEATRRAEPWQRRDSVPGKDWRRGVVRPARPVVRRAGGGPGRPFRRDELHREDGGFGSALTQRERRHVGPSRFSADAIRKGG